MSREVFIPEQGSFTVVIAICGFVASLGWGRAIHACSVKCRCDQDDVVASLLIAVYTKCGLAEEATEIFDMMPKRDTVAWNAMLLAQTYHGSAAQAFHLFRSMIQAGLSTRSCYLSQYVVCLT